MSATRSKYVTEETFQLWLLNRKVNGKLNILMFMSLQLYLTSIDFNNVAIKPTLSTHLFP